MTTFRITGTVIDRETGSGVPRLRVETWDKDLIFDDLVGTAITDDQGTFQIEFDETYFQELFLDQRPDLYFKVFGYGQLIRNTEDSVLWNVGAGDTTVTIEVDIPEQPQGRTCATMEIHRGLLRDPEYARSRREIESFTRYYIQRNAGTGLRTGIVRIPVVVHVVYNTAAQNISDAQIQSQIDILNQDYRRLNVDVGSVPGVFAPLTADARIEFHLAVRDPNCNPTTGITRTPTSVTVFSYDHTQAGTSAGEPVKFTSSGGHDAWPRDKYLNLWVCKLPIIPGLGQLLGYAQFPAKPWPATDGVAIDYRYFGNIGTATAPFDRGRTATHEIGHWLNLLHIWGDDGNACSGSDQVDDTPNQGGNNGGCPSFPSISCSNGPNGDMFMNYMDYTDDACMFMFTAGQAARIDAALAIAPRAAILGSDGLIPPPSPATPDLWSQNTPQDIGNEPDSLSATFYQSDDIWVRTTNDGFVNQEHQNPQYRPPALGLPNYVYVRVRNRGCASASSATLKLYWAKASTGLSWPAPWDGSVTTPALMGGSIIPSQPTGSVAGGGFVILEFPWYPPNPLDYISFGADRSHFCLLSRIETSATPPYGMTFPEGSDLGANVRNNNNIVWKNVDVVEASPGGNRIAWVTVGNFEPEELQTKLVFTTPKEAERQKTVFEWATVKVYLGKRLFQKWQNGDQVGSGIQVSGRYTIQILEPNAWIGNIKLSPKELYTLRAEVKPFEDRTQGNEIFFLDVLQYASGYAPSVALSASTVAIVERFVGGQRFVFKTIYVPPDPDILNLWIWDGVDWVIPPDTDTAEVPVI